MIANGNGAETRERSDELVVDVRRKPDRTIETKDGPMQEMDLRKRTIIDDNENEIAIATEYRKYGNDEIVHRSVHVHLKRATVYGEAIAASLS